MKEAVASAPGRLDVMGGIADYSGSLVLQMPISLKTEVHLRFNETGLLRFKSVVDGRQRDCSIWLSDLLNDGLVDLLFAREYFEENHSLHWAAYPAGCLLVLMQETGVEIYGATAEITTQVPEGKGVSSSAALEVATLRAACEALSIKTTGTQLATWAQMAENLVVGAPCGLMDQLASHHGRQGALLPIVCQPDIMAEPIDLPEGMHLVGVDSGQRHYVGGASYSMVRTAAFMGYAILVSLAKPQVHLRELYDADIKSKMPWGGYLANVSVEEWQAMQASLPEEMTGARFLEQYGFLPDEITRVDEEATYKVRVCTAHPIMEHGRVKAFQAVLANANGRAAEVIDALKLGELIYASHASYSACGLGSPATDNLVRLVREMQQAGLPVYGAKITGGGSGGTVCILALGDAGLDAVEVIAAAHAKEFPLGGLLIR